MAVKQFNVAVAMVFDEQERILLVRRRGADHYQLPGGKIEDGETASDAVCREVLEEVELMLRKDSLTFVGQADGRAMVDYEATVSAQVFTGEASGSARPASEIEDLIWFDLNQESDVKLAHLLRSETIPLARQYLAGSTLQKPQGKNLRSRSVE